MKMSLSAIYILDLNGNILISRDYRGDVDKTNIEKFLSVVQKNEDAGIPSPIMHENGTSYAYIKLEDLYVIATMKRNVNICLTFTFLYKLISILTHYLNEPKVESVKDNFVIIYELLDEIMDFGYPQITETTLICDYIMQKSYKLKENSVNFAANVTNCVSWRPQGIKYSRNELFIDVIESVNLLVNSKGTILKNEVSGCVKMKVHLSGTPQLRLGLSDKISSLAEHDSIRFEDVKFHHCVQLSRIADKSVHFIPPDGEFQLLSYRLNTHLKPLIFIESAVTKTASTRIEYSVKARAQFKSASRANHVEIVVPVDQDVDSPKIKATLGSAVFVPERSAVVWKIKYFEGSTEQVMQADFRLSTLRSEVKQERIPVLVEFVIPYFTVSGFQIKHVKVIEKENYKALPWVRYTTKNGEYMFK